MAAELARGKPLQIISIGDPDNPSSSEQKCFLIQKNLDEIFSKIPRNTEVSILSVVGKFRSGKSFILNLFLRYLRSKNIATDESQSEAWMSEDGETLSEGNCNQIKTAVQR